MSSLRILTAITVLSANLWAESVTGSVLIKKKLTKPSVTSAVSIYQRGTPVALGKDTGGDPLGLERTHVVIWLEGAAGIVDAGKVTRSISQVDRRFSPDLIAVPVGSTVLFPNMDPIFHNVFSLSKLKQFDLGNYPKGQARSVVFSKPGIEFVNCRLHPNMAATIVVTPNQWYTRADQAGRFNIDNVPPGHYTAVAWHKAAGFFRESIEVEAGRDAVISFFIPVGADGLPMLSGKVSETKN